MSKNVSGKKGFERRLKKDGSPNPKYVDLLEVDKPIAGQSFGSGATVKFIGNEGTEVSASSVTVNSSSSITAVIAKSSFVNAKEPYDVKVTNNSGLSRASNLYFL